MLKPGSKFITLKLPSNYDNWFQLESKESFKMSWGRITVFFLKKLNVSK